MIFRFIYQKNSVENKSPLFRTDTSSKSPQDMFAAGEEPLWDDAETYHLSPRYSAILLARNWNNAGSAPCNTTPAGTSRLRACYAQPGQIISIRAESYIL